MTRLSKDQVSLPVGTGYTVQFADTLNRTHVRLVTLPGDKGLILGTVFRYGLNPSLSRSKPQVQHTPPLPTHRKLLAPHPLLVLRRVHPDLPRAQRLVPVPVPAAHKLPRVVLPLGRPLLEWEHFLLPLLLAR